MQRIMHVIEVRPITVTMFALLGAFLCLSLLGTCYKLLRHHKPELLEFTARILESFKKRSGNQSDKQELVPSLDEGPEPTKSRFKKQGKKKPSRKAVEDEEEEEEDEDSEQGTEMTSGDKI